MATFVLVHGGWHGGWCWKYVTPLLRAAGHAVFTTTLTGVGERAHLARPDTGLETHIQDVIGVFTYEDLHDVVLVGHSLGGPVITGVADRIPERLAHLVYLDASVPRDGQADVDCYPPEFGARAWAEGLRAEGKHVISPIAEEQPFGITNQEDVRWLTAKLTPHPIQAFLDPIHLKNPSPQVKTRTFIVCTMADPAWTSVERACSEPGWHVHELPTGHDAMVIAPQALVDVLLSIVKRVGNQERSIS
jgi:pimeloyl-ACP methyl ester carboxylesterase